MTKPICIGLAITHSFAGHRRMVRGIGRYAAAKPEWEFTFMLPEAPPRRVPALFRPDGLIASVNTEQLARALSSWRRPVVNVSSVFPGLRFPRVGPDNALIGRMAADHFLERGVRQFGFVGPPGYLFATERAAAFCQAVREAGHAVTCYEGIAHLPFDPLGRRWDLGPAVLRWLRALPKPVGIFVASDSWGVQVVEACQHATLRVPEDVAILGVDDDALYCELARPPLSSIVIPAEQIGYEAAALFERLLAGKPAPRGPILLPPVGVTTRRSTEILAIDDPEVVAAVRFIREHGHLPLRVADILKQVPVARRSLERRCRQALGWGLGKEIRRTHVERARRLLAGTDLPLKRLAQQAGFSDYHHIAVFFHQELGLTAAAFRRQMRGPAEEVIS